MAFSLIDDIAGATPIAMLTKDALPKRLAEAPEYQRNWLTAVGFSAEQGKLALVPGEDGRLAITDRWGDVIRRYGYDDPQGPRQQTPAA